MELDHRALALRKPFEGPMEQGGPLSKLDGHEVGLGRSLRVDLEVRQLSTLLSAPMLADQVHRNRHHPWAELRAPAEVVASAVETEKRLLHDLLRELVVPQLSAREA
jgi:hypothetical protein